MKKRCLIIISLLLCIPINAGSGHPVGNPDKPKMELFPKQQPDGSWGYQGQNGPKPQQHSGMSLYEIGQQAARYQEERTRAYYAHMQSQNNANNPRPNSPIANNFARELQGPRPVINGQVLDVNGQMNGPINEKISPNFEEVALAKKEQEDRSEAMQHQMMAEQKKQFDEHEKERAQKEWDAMIERNEKFRRDLEAQQNAEKIKQALNSLFSPNTTQTTQTPSTQSTQSSNSQAPTTTQFTQQQINEITQSITTAISHRTPSAQSITTTSSHTASNQASGNNQSTSPSNISIPNPLNVASKVLGNASDLLVGGSAQGMAIPNVPSLSPELFARIISGSSIHSSKQEAQDFIDSIKSKTTSTPTTTTTQTKPQDAAKKEELLFSMKTWLAKESAPLPTIPEAPETISPCEVARTHPIEAKLEAEKAIAPKGIDLALPESKPLIKGSNLVTIALLQQLAKQSAAKEKASDAAISIPQPNIHNWEEPAPSNTRIEHKPGNTEIKTSRGNNNYTLGTNILFYPITYVLGKLVDSMQPTPQVPETKVPTYYPLSPDGYDPFSGPDAWWNNDKVKAKSTRDTFNDAYEAYQNGGRKSPTRRRYKALIQASNDVLTLSQDKPVAIPQHIQDQAAYVIKHQYREAKKIKKEVSKEAKKNASSNSGNNSGKGPNKDPNKDPNKIVEDIKNLAEVAKKAGDDAKKQAERNLDQQPLTNKDAKKIAESMGFEEKKAPFDTRNNKAFYHPKKKIWISADEDCHNGGVWKMFRGGRREGTYNKDLTIRIKD